MADNTTGLHVKSLSTESVRSKLVDTGGTNEAAISAAGRISVDGSGVTQPVSGTVAVSSITTSVTPGTAAANLGKAQGAAYAANDVGVMSLGVRNDAGTVLTGSADQDYVPLTTDATGALRVTGGSGATQYVEDVGSAGAESLTLAGAVRQDTIGSSTTTDGDYAYLKVTAAGRLYTSATVDAALPAGTNNIGDVDIITVPAPLSTTGGGTEATALRVTIANDSTGVVSIDDNGGSLTVNGTVSVTGVATAANQTNHQLVDNAAFTDGTTTVIMGGYIFDEAAGTALTENDAAAARIDAKRAQVFVGEDASTRGQKWAINASGALSGNLTHYGGTSTTLGQKAMAASIPITIASDQSALSVTVSSAAVAGTTAHDAAAAAVNPVLIGAYASAAAPTAVSADGDAVDVWALRNGSPVVNLASGGTLITIGQKTMANAFSVSIASDQSAVAGNITQVGGSTISATNPVSSRLTDGTAFYANTGQTAGTAHFSRITDATNTAAVIATINSLKTDFSSVAGAVPSATNPVPVRITDGSAFYSAASDAPVDPKFSTQTSAALGAGASATVTHYVTSGKTGQLTGVDVASTIPMKVVINTVVTGTPTVRVVLFSLAGQPIMWRAPYKTYITRASADASSGFSVTITNKDATVAADVYSTGYWDEV